MHFWVNAGRSGVIGDFLNKEPKVNCEVWKIRTDMMNKMQIVFLCCILLIL